MGPKYGLCMLLNGIGLIRFDSDFGWGADLEGVWLLGWCAVGVVSVVELSALEQIYISVELSVCMLWCGWHGLGGSSLQIRVCNRMYV